MSKVFLTVIFLINGEWQSHPNFEPLLAPSYEECIEKLPYVETYLYTISPYEFKLECVVEDEEA